MAVMAFGSSCHALDFPEDQPTLEALIDLHKDMKSAEDRAMENIAVSLGEQSAVTNKTVDFHDVKTTLNTKLSSGEGAGSVLGLDDSLYYVGTNGALVKLELR